MSENAFSTGWELSKSITVQADAAAVYHLVSDITRMGEWSPECYGGSWVGDAAGEQGSRFHGFNREGEMMWVSESVVTRADADQSFEFSVMRFRPGGPDEEQPWTEGSEIGDTIWGFDIQGDGAATVLTQRHAMKRPNPFYRAMLADLSESERVESMTSRREILGRAMAVTLERIKDVAEQGR